MATKGIRGLYKRGRIWWMTYSVEKTLEDGTTYMDPIRTSTGKTKMGDAEKILDAMRLAINTGHYIPEEKREATIPHPWDATCDSYLEDRGRRGKLTSSYRKLEDWKGAFGSRDVSTITLDDVETQLAAWKDGKKWSAATFNNALAVVSGALSYAYKKGWIDRHPLKGRAERMQTPGGRERYFLPFEITAMREASPAWLSDAILGAAFTGLRKGNFCALTCGDVSKDERDDMYLHVGREKNGEPIAKRITGELRTIVERRLGSRTPAAVLFPGPGDGRAYESLTAHLPGIVAKVAAQHPDWNLRWGVKDNGVTFHSFRHAMASLALNAGVPMDVVQKMGGWKTASQVRVYARRADESIRDGEDALAEVLQFHTVAQSAADKTKTA
jgi:integrase